MLLFEIILIISCSVFVLSVITVSIIRKKQGKSSCSGCCSSCKGCNYKERENHKDKKVYKEKKY